MRWLALIAWLPAPALALGPVNLPYTPAASRGLPYGAVPWDGFGLDTQTLFDAPLKYNGIVSTWSFTDVPEPDVVWDADCPTGPGTCIATHDYTLTGSVTTGVDTPFCPDGSHSDLTSGCMQAVMWRPKGNNYYTADAGNIANCSGDCTVCSVFMLFNEGDVNEAIASQRDPSGANNGWWLYFAGTTLYMFLDGDGGFVQASGSVLPYANQWVLACGVVDDGTDITVFVNGVEGTPQADTTGAVDGSGGDFIIGNAEYLAFTADWTGFISKVFYWNSELTDGELEALWEDFSGILDSKGAPVSFANVGPLCAWFDSTTPLRHCLADNWPVLGAALPPGVTGAGSPASGYLANESLTNSVLYSRDLTNAAWQDLGTPDNAASTVVMFRDGRTVYKLTDNDGGNIEGNYQVIAKGAHTSATMCITHATESGSGNVNIWIQEATGGSCGDPYTADTDTTSTSLDTFCISRTFSDSNCSDINVGIQPTDGVAASTGHVAAVVELWFDQSWGAPVYCETAASAVGCGDDLLTYDISGVLPTVAEGTVVSMNVTYSPGAATLPSGQMHWVIEDSATAFDYYRGASGTSTGKYGIVARSTEEGSPVVLYVANDNMAWTAGTTYAVEATIDLDAAAFARDGTPYAGTNLTLSNAPDSLDELTLGKHQDKSSPVMGAWFDSAQVKK